MALIRGWIRGALADRMLRGSALLLLATVELAAGGFLFWQVVAHRFGPADIGRANAMISASVLIGGFALLGMHNSVIRFRTAWPDPGVTASTAYIVVSGTATGASVLFVVTSGWLAPQTGDTLRQPAVAALFTLSTCAYSLCLVSDSVFVGAGRAGLVLGRNSVIVLLRLAFAGLLGAWGAIGVLAAYQGSVVLAMLTFVVVIGRRFGAVPRPMPRPSGAPAPRINPSRRDRLAAMWRYSAWNYLATVILTTPWLVMPVMVAERVDATSAGYYTIASLLASVLAFVPQATSRSFFAEAMRDPQRLHSALGRVIRLTVVAEVPVLVLLVVGGRVLLGLFGPGYPTAYPLLVLLATTQALTSVGFIGSTLLMISGRLKLLCLLSAVASTAALAGAYLVLGRGLVWAGSALLAGELILVAGYTVLIAAEYRGSRPTARSTAIIRSIWADQR